MKFNRLKLGDEILNVHLSPPEPERDPPAQGTGRLNSARQPMVHVISGKDQLVNPQDDQKNGTGTFEFPYTAHLRLRPGYKTLWILN